jgi:hypothetical protein
MSRPQAPQPLVRVGAVLAVAGAAWAGWYLGSPLLVNRVVSDNLPAALAPSQAGGGAVAERSSGQFGVIDAVHLQAVQRRLQHGRAQRARPKADLARRGVRPGDGTGGDRSWPLRRGPGCRTAIGGAAPRAPHRGLPGGSSSARCARAAR